MKTVVEQHEEGDKVGTGIQWVGDVKIKRELWIRPLPVNVLPMRVFLLLGTFPISAENVNSVQFRLS